MLRYQDAQIPHLGEKKRKEKKSEWQANNVPVLGVLMASPRAQYRYRGAYILVVGVCAAHARDVTQSRWAR